MMGQQCRSESLFYYFRIEDHVPEGHLLRAIDRYVSLEFVSEKLKPFYSETGRPSDLHAASHRCNLDMR
jgi:transposase